MNKMIVNIIIPTYKRFESLKKTMYSIKNSDYKETFTTIVADGFDDRNDHFKDSQTNILYNAERKGWVYSMNRVLGLIEGDLYFYGADDIQFYPDCISKLVKAMKMIFPTGNGLVSAKQHMILSQKKINPKKCGGAFGLMGRAFVDRFPDHQVFCPDYSHGGADRELRNFAVKAGCYHFCQDAIVLHSRDVKDETRRLRKEASPQDNETMKIRRDRELFWGETFERVRR